MATTHRPLPPKRPAAPARSASDRSTLLPLALGCSFPLAATLLDIIGQGLPLSLGSVLTVQATQPLHWLLDLVPVAMFFLPKGKTPSVLAAVSATQQHGAQRPAPSPAVASLAQQQKSITTVQAELASMKSQLEKAHASEASLLATVDNAKDAILTLGTDGTVVTANRGAENMLGWSRQEMVGHPLSNLLTLSSLPAMEAHLTQSLTNPSAPSIIEVEFVHSNGQGLWTEGCTSVIRNASGTATGVVVIYRDLSHWQQRPGGHITSLTPQGDTQPQQELELEPEATASPLFSYQVSQSDKPTVPGLLTDLAPAEKALSESDSAPSFTIPLVAKSEPQREETPSAPVQFAFVDASESGVHGSPSFPTEFPFAEESAPQQGEAFSAPVQFTFIDDLESKVHVSPLAKSEPQQEETSSAPVQFTFVDESETEPRSPSSAFTSFSFADQAKPESPGPASRPFNFSEALSNIGGDEDLLAELAGIFLEEYPELLENIRTAVANDDREALIYHAHALKGSVSNFVALDTEGAARRLEQLGREGNLMDAPTVLGELETALSRLAPALSDLALQGAA